VLKADDLLGDPSWREAVLGIAGKEVFDALGESEESHLSG